MEDFSSAAINNLRQNARSMVRELGLLNDAYCDIGITLAERHLLIELGIFPSPTMSEITERFFLDKSTISRLISKSVKKGYVDCITDKNDKRKRFLHLTEKGREVLHAFEPIAFNQTKDALLTLTKEEISIVYRGVDLYAKGLRNSRTQKKNNTNVENKPKESLEELYERLNRMGFILDLFDKNDEEELYKIFQEVVNSGSQFPYESTSMQEFHLHFFNPTGKLYVCRTKAGEVIGSFYIKPNHPGRSSHIANGGYMMKGTYRSKGIGSILVKASLLLAKDLGFQFMQFNLVLSQNTPAVKLYEKLGFNIIGTLPQAVRNPKGSYQDGYIMHRKLD